MPSFRAHAARALVRCGDEDGIRYAIEQVIPSPVVISGSSPYYTVHTLKYIVQVFGTDLSNEFRFLIQNISNNRGISQEAFRELVQVEAYCRLSGDLASADAYRQLLDDCVEKPALDLKGSYLRLTSERPVWGECIKLIGDLLPYERGALQRLPSPGPPPVTYVDAFLELRKVRETMSASKYNSYLKSIYLGEVESTNNLVHGPGAIGLQDSAIVTAVLLFLGILVVLVVYVSFA